MVDGGGGVVVRRRERGDGGVGVKVGRLGLDLYGMERARADVIVIICQAHSEV